MTENVVTTGAELMAAAADHTVTRIVVRGEIADLPTLWLAPGQALVGSDGGATLRFAANEDGLGLTRDNDVSAVRVEVDTVRRAVRNDTAVEDLGTLRLAGLTVVGQVEILVENKVRAGHVVVDGLDILAADTRDRSARPALLGVGVVPGAFTVWNRQPEAEVVLTADLRGISVGREGAPVRGSGVFVFGAGRAEGRVMVSRLETGPVFTDGGLADGTSDTITGGVFVGYGAHVDQTSNRGPVTTYGVNDMVLDNWGAVDVWTAHEPLRSYGRNGVGMVNFGSLGVLRIEAPIETRGPGARGFNVYRLDEQSAPAVGEATFDSITTRGDAAVGIQIGQPVGHITVRRGIRTEGGTGDALVRGAIVRVSAHALSVQPGGRVERIDAGGPISSDGAEIAAIDVRGEVASMSVRDGIRATGAGADAVTVEGGALDLSDTAVQADDGVAIRVHGRLHLRDVTARGARGDVVVQP